MTSQERRRSPRIVDKDLSLKLKTGEFDTITHTLNLSASGIYCKIDKEIPLMSRVKLVLMIPDQSRADKKATSIDVEGVVVRGHPVIINGEIKHYDVAIFFDTLPPKSAEIISSYIASKRS